MRGSDFDVDHSHTQVWVNGPQSHFSRLLFGPNPNCTGSADQRERVLANDLCRSFQLESDGIIGKRPNCAEFVGDADHRAGRVGAVANQLLVIDDKIESRINALSGIALCNHLLALDVTLNAEVSPFVKDISELNDKGRVAKVGKLLPVGIRFSDQFAVN